jgi:hypothetical protein
MPPIRPQDTQYTFTTLRPLPHLPNPQKALSYLERLRDDPGIRSVMRKYKWTVPVLAEMEPLGNTDMHSKTLGRNHGGGQLIEIRLRTDAYDGYRDYKTVRKTMAHELAHNVYGDHDRNFWDLCGRLEKEIEKGDWKSGGRRLTDQVFYEPPERQTADEGAVGWTGGVQKLGGGLGAQKLGGAASAAPSAGDAAAARREMMARAAEERAKKLAVK